MTIDTLKDLKAVIQLCKKAGIDHIKIGDIELWVDIYASKEKPSTFVKTASQQPTTYIPGGVTAETKVPETMPEQLEGDALLFYSVGDVSQ